MAGATVLSIAISTYDGYVKVAGSGELDAFTGPRFRKAVDACVYQRPSNLMIDLTAVTFAGSEAIDLVQHAIEACRSAAIALSVRVNDAEAKLFGAVGLNDVIPFERGAAVFNVADGRDGDGEIGRFRSRRRAASD